MKKITTLLASLLVAVATFAQVPQGFSYQAVVRDAQNAIVANQQVNVTISILQGATAESATAVFSETHSALTNANGLFTLTIGSVETAKFAAIDWTAGPAFLKTESAYGTAVTQLLSVPFALYAAKAGSAEVDLSNYATKQEIPTDYVSTSALNTAISGVEAKIPAATDLSEYYKKADVDALLAELNAKVTKLDKQLNPPIPGVIEFAFSVSADKQIYFSQGNLQYQASTGTWRFAENQYDMIGSDNSNISSSYSGWIDLFGWGTSGWNSGANAYQPYRTSTSSSDYCPGGDYNNNLTGDYANADWGVNNAISNGGNKAGLWRTLTKDEWSYLTYKRTNASSKYGVATVNNVNGLVLLPDSWTLPDGVTFNSGRANLNGSDYYKTVNDYSAEEWAKMEANGAVFLPAAGYRTGTAMLYVGSNGLYWLSSVSDSEAYRAYSGNFHSSNVYVIGSNFRDGLSVRLVRGVEE
ncbi:MAG: hypothetical protein K6E73_06855 [Bacteroidales bacterium]|nr:hypothetical protein [Bacteroidales bacterium]